MSFVNDGSSGLKYFPQLPAFTTEEIMTSFHKAVPNQVFIYPSEFAIPTYKSVVLASRVCSNGRP